MKKIARLFDYSISILLTIITITFLVFLKLLNIIPIQYFLIIAIILMLITLIIDYLFLIILKSSHHKITILIKGLLSLLVIILILGYSYGTYCIERTVNLLDKNTNLQKEETDYYIVVLTDSIYEETSDLYNKTLAYLQDTDDTVLSHLKLDLTYTTETNSLALKEKLYQKDVDALLISDIIKKQFEDQDSDFTTKTKIIKTISITNNLEDITKKVSIKNTPFSIYLAGIDSYGDINKTTRNDVNIIATVNPNSNKILLTSIPRDYYVQLYNTTGYKDKLTHASYYGLNTAIKTIEDLLAIDINYYVKVNFTTVIDLVDELGGVEVYADQQMTSNKCNFTVGYNTVDGRCALVFARERHSYIDGDRHRGRNQQELIKAIFNKITQNGTNVIYKYTSILDTLDGKFTTNLSREDILNYIKFELNDLSKYEITTVQLDGEGAMLETYSYPNQKLWVMLPDESTISNAKTAIQELLNS